jgi:hypothetical protein
MRTAQQTARSILNTQKPRSQVRGLEGRHFPVLLILMPILPELLLPFVSCDFSKFTLSSTGHFALSFV